MVLRSCAFVIGLSLLGAAAAARGLTRHDAEQLVWVQLRQAGLQRKLPALNLNWMKPDHGFYIVGIDWNGLPEGGVDYDYYAVDQATGDIWGAIGCRKI